MFNRYGDVLIVTTDVEVNVEDVLGELDTETLLNEVYDRGELDKILSRFEIDTLEDFIIESGGYSLNKFSIEELQSELLKRDAPPIVPNHVLVALQVLGDYLTPKQVESKRGLTESLSED